AQYIQVAERPIYARPTAKPEERENKLGVYCCARVDAKRWHPTVELRPTVFLPDSDRRRLEGMPLRLLLAVGAPTFQRPKDPVVVRPATRYSGTVFAALLPGCDYDPKCAGTNIRSGLVAFTRVAYAIRASRKRSLVQRRERSYRHSARCKGRPFGPLN